MLGPTVNDEFSDVDSILYMMTGDGRRLCAAEEGRRRPAPAAPEGGPASPRSISTAPRTSASSSSSPRQAGDARHHAAGAVRLARQAEQRDAGRYGRNLVAAGAAARHRRARWRQGGGGDAGRKQRPRVPARRYRDRHPRLRRSADLPGARQEGKPALGIGVVTAKGANILELGKEVDARRPTNS